MPKKLRSPEKIIINGRPLFDIIKDHSLFIESYGKYGTRADLQAADLQMTNIYGADLQGANLSKADLQGADLRETNLQGVDLMGVNLREADLQGTNLREANLQGSKLQGAKLQGANLQRAKLQGADLLRANLLGADFSEADLREANLKGANLQKADLWRANLLGSNLSKAGLQGAYLLEANFQGTDIREANLEGANLKNANLLDTNLQDTNLQEANLQGAKLPETNLQGAYLQGACLKAINLRGADLQRIVFENCDLRLTDLRYSDLRFAKLNSANITGCKLYGAATDNWEIKGIKCDYIFFDEEGKNRYPKDRDFEEGEFELYHSPIPIVEYIFKDGITPLDPFIMDYIAFKLGSENPEYDISLISFEKLGPYPKAKFSVKSEEYIQPAEKDIDKEYQHFEKIENKIDLLSGYLKQVINKPRKLYIKEVKQLTVKAEHVEIHIQNIINNITEIQQIIDKAPKKSFIEKRKEDVQAIIRNAIATLAVTHGPAALSAATSAAKSVIDTVQYLGPELLKQIAPYIDALKTAAGF